MSALNQYGQESLLANVGDSGIRRTLEMEVLFMGLRKLVGTRIPVISFSPNLAFLHIEQWHDTLRFICIPY